jgi:hypothetical protein
MNIEQALNSIYKKKILGKIYLGQDPDPDYLDSRIRNKLSGSSTLHTKCIMVYFHVYVKILVLLCLIFFCYFRSEKMIYFLLQMKMKNVIVLFSSLGVFFLLSLLVWGLKHHIGSWFKVRAHTSALLPDYFPPIRPK